MSNQYTFPAAYVDLRDNSVQTVPDPTVIPLHLPVFIVFAEQGPTNELILGGTNALKAIFGSQFLNERSPYYQHPNVFMARALRYQQAYVMRVADPAATPASLVVLCTVTSGELVQYQRTSSGAIVYNGAGQPTPLLQSDGVTQVSQPGVTLVWSTRPLAVGETVNSIETITSTTGGVTTTTYPMLAVQADVGSAGGNKGFRLFYTNQFDTNAVMNMNAMTYAFQPVVLDPQTNIEAPFYDIYNDTTQTFAFQDGAFDASTASYYDLADVVNQNFTGTNGLPYSFYTFGENAELIGQAVLGVSPELGSVSPFLINILSGVDQSGNPYRHMVTAPSSTSILNQNVVLYLQGGGDGSLSKTMLETLTSAVCAGELCPQIGDSFRYPFTHLYDSGYSLATKQNLLNIFGLRDDVKVELSTQDVALRANTASQDQSTGSSLRTAALLNPESTDFGTQTTRVSIYQQCGLLSDTNVYKTIVPATIDRMIKRCLYNGTDHVVGEPKGRPFSEVTVLQVKSINWTPTSPQQQQLSWNTGLNYMQFCDVNTLFYADLLSVYPLDSSLLSSDVMCDYASVYLKRVIRRTWTIVVGRDDPPKTLFQSIAKQIDAAANYAFSGYITTSTVVSQTAVDTALGYQLTVTTTVLGNPTNRVWKVIVPIQRAAVGSAN